jgi:hypothetical protein
VKGNAISDMRKHEYFRDSFKVDKFCLFLKSKTIFHVGDAKILKNKHKMIKFSSKNGQKMYGSWIF